jgi:HAD superfamily hydrolase (TIGR01456 family)
MDGVLLKGSNPVPGAPDALRILQARSIPWILMTNGGGISEADRAKALTSKLGIDVRVEQIVQSHTPLTILPDRENLRVLVIGGNRDYSRRVAQGYGFKQVLIPADFIKTNPSIWPFHNKDSLEFGEVTEGVDDLPIDKILIFNDPRDMGTDVQVISDILARQPDTHVIFSNDDWLWASDYKSPRFGQGVTRFLLEQLFQRNHGKPLNKTVLGKPTKTAYDFAHHVLINQSSKEAVSTAKFGDEITNSPMKEVFMVGDNPASDIIGAYNYGWNTCLVKTGVYKDGDKLPCKPTIIGDNVLHVVTDAVKKVGLW